MSGRALLNAALAALLLATWGLIWVLRPDRTRRNFRWVPQMNDALAFEAQRGSLPGRDPVLAGLPPRGTAPRGLRPLHYAATPADAERAGRELVNPLPLTPANLARGQAVYATFCFPCHGATGAGDGPVTKRGVPAPPNLLGEKTAALPDGRMFHILTYGQGNMPSYASQVAREDRWRAILHVRAMQAPTKAAEAAR